MYGRTIRFAALGVAVALLACATRASVVVHVETDIPWGTDSLMRSIRVRVYSGVGDQTAARYDYTAPLGRQPGTVAIPVRFGVLPLNNDASRTVTVRVDGCDDNACRAESSVLVTQHAIFSFIEGEQRELPMFLAMSCQRMPCSFPQTTCRMGVCVDPRIPPEQLVPSAWGFFDASTPRDTSASDGAVVDAVVTDAPVADTTATDMPPVVDVGTDTPTADVRDASVVDAGDATVTDVVDAPSLDARTDVTDVPAMDLFTMDARDVTGPDTFDAGSVDVRDATVADTLDAPAVDVRDGGSADAVDVFDNGFPCLCRTLADCPQPRFNCCDSLITNRCGSLNLALVCIADLTCR